MLRKVDRIILVGTSHVGVDDTKKIEDLIQHYMPEVVGIELDAKRFKSLMKQDQKQQNPSYKQTLAMMKEYGTFGFLFAQIAGFVQKKIGKKMDIKPGIDMKTAYLKARELKIPVSLIDQDIKQTLKKLSSLSFLKKISLFSGLFFKSFKKEYRELLNFDIKKVPSEKLIIKMIGVLKKESPYLYDILIHQRNIYMSKRLLKLRERHTGYILAVVGAGHVDGMAKYLSKELSGEGSETHTISYSFNADVEHHTNLL